MDPSVHYLMGNHVPDSEGATIHSIVPPPPESDDNKKIGFTVDVAGRLDREQADEDAPSGVVVPFVEDPPQELADSA
jgi:hypothetical protein